MNADRERDLVIGISSTALFDLRAADEIFRTQGLDEYGRYQIAHEHLALEPGTGFPLVRMLLRLNEVPDSPRRIVVIVMSRNSADTSLRIFHSAQAHGLPVTRAALTGGASLCSYLKAFHVDLFLSTREADVRAALRDGTAAAFVYDPPAAACGAEPDQIRIAFDGDAVLFSDEAERIYQAQGLEAFLEHECRNAHLPLPDGPFARLFRDLALIQRTLRPGHVGLRTALVTARDGPAHERVIRTLRAWDAHVDEAFFLGGLPKHEILRAFRPQIFFDDQPGHCALAAAVVPTGRVPGSITAGYGSPIRRDGRSGR